MSALTPLGSHSHSHLSFSHALTYNTAQPPICRPERRMEDVIRDFGTVAARISTYGLDEGRVVRLQESAYFGHYDFLHKIHSLAVNRM